MKRWEKYLVQCTKKDVENYEQNEKSLLEMSFKISWAIEMGENHMWKKVNTERKSAFSSGKSINVWRHCYQQWTKMIRELSRSERVGERAYHLFSPSFLFIFFGYKFKLNSQQTEFPPHYSCYQKSLIYSLYSASCFCSVLMKIETLNSSMTAWYDGDIK